MQDGTSDTTANPEREPIQAPSRRRLWGRAALAVAAAFAIFFVATILATLATNLGSHLLGFGEAGAQEPGVIAARQAARLGIFLVAMQVLTVVLTLAAVRLFVPSISTLLPFRRPPGGWRGILLAIVVLLVLSAAGGALVYAFDRSALASDMKPFADMAQSRAWWILFVAAAVGAPFAEELLFRGLLYGVLRESPAGFPGAAIATALMWSALHANYSVYGVAMIVGIGLYFAYLREKSGSLIPSIACHAVYNGMIVLALAMSPDNAFSAP